MAGRISALVAAILTWAWHFQRIAVTGAHGGGTTILFVTGPLAFTSACLATYLWFKDQALD